VKNRSASLVFAGVLLGAAVCCVPQPARGEAMIQYFNTSWKELAHKMPELAEVGYNSIWLPPPQKGSGGLSVGYDHWDPFDFGSIDQRGSIRTRYGTEAELLRLVEIAHRFGIRVYFDNIMNHRAFDVPGFNEFTPIDIYPGMVPEDFHLRVTEEGFFRKWDNTRDWNDAWQVLNLGLADLIDIAHETPNTNFGTNEGDDHPKISFVRQPDHPEWHFDFDLPIGVTNPATQIGFTVFTFANKEPFEDTGYTNSSLVFVSGAAGNDRFDWEDLDGDGQHDAGEPSEPFTDTGLDPTRPGWDQPEFGFGDGVYNMGNPVEEDVGAYLIRAVTYAADHTHVDGFRLDAVKHVPDFFFGAFNDDVSDAGYLGGVQRQYNISRGYSDWDNHRDTVFDTEKNRDDAMVFGEHLGQPPGFGGYIATGMRLVDNDLRSLLNGVLGNPSAGLQGLDAPGAGGFSPEVGVMHAQSHDNDFAAVRELQHAFYFTRAGLPLIYTDGNFQAETLGESGGAFPRHANTAFLGQFGDFRIPNVVDLHNHFARGEQIPKWSDGDVIAYERRDKRENVGMSDADGTVLAFLLNDNLADGQFRDIPTTFPEGAFLWNYADRFGRNDNGFYHTVQNGTISVVVPPGGYFAFSWRSPEESDMWAPAGGDPVMVYENGEPAGFVSYERRDGPDGDPGFNPFGVADTNSEDFAYTWFVPRITSGTNLRFVARVDGSAKNVLMKLDGGVDLNGATHASGDPRDNPPALSSDVFLGYEQMSFKHRQWAEKFAAVDVSRNVVGSLGAESYESTIGTAGFTVNEGGGPNTDDNTATWVFHDPASTNEMGDLQFDPAPENAAGSDITVWVKIGYACDINKVFLYYTTDGASFPEGAGGEGIGNTQVVELLFDSSGTPDGTGTPDWWTGTIPALPNGTVLRYKIGAFSQQGGPCDPPFEVVFPTDQNAVDRKKRMLTVFEVNDFDATTVSYRPHNDFGPIVTGLEDGFHFLQARAFLERDNRAAIYNTFPQTVYLDLETPQGEVRFPSENDTLGSQEFGVVVRTDRTVTDVQFHIDDGDPANDDGATGAPNGNGLDSNGVPAWASAFAVTPNVSIDSAFPDEWRFTYRNIPSSGAATLQVRLFEISSTTNNGHFTTLTRNVTADGPDQAMFVAHPTFDGQVVDSNFVMKVYFSRSLGDGVSDETLIDRFLIRINGVAQGKEQYTITRDIIDPNFPGDFHELAFPLPNLFNGDPDFLHLIEVTHETGGGVELQASRLVKAAPADTGPFVEITEPTEFDQDGKPTVIELPDVANPQPEDRQFTIRVETDLSAKNVWVEFDTSGFTPGSAGAVEAIETKLAGAFSANQGSTSILAEETNLSGTVTALTSNNTITGTGTAFTSELIPGQVIAIASNDALVVTQVVSDTELQINLPYPGPDTNGALSALQPRLLSELTTSETVKVDTNLLQVSQVLSDSNLTTTAPYPGPTASGLMAFRVDGNPAIVGSRKFWDFDWTNITEGSYRFRAHVNTNGFDRSVTNATATRNVSVIFLELVEADEGDEDDDDDGIRDDEEQNAFNLPPTNPETWTNWNVKAWAEFGSSDSLSPDTDRDGLPDGLEIGMRRLEIDAAQTDTNADTNGDGTLNFLSDLDPPIYNTVPDNGCGQQPGPAYCVVNSPVPFNFQGSRTALLGGSTTDPLNPDTDFDGIPDGVEDANHNGWVDGDGDPFPGDFENPNFTFGGVERTWPDGVLEQGDQWTETDPNNSDTDGDGATDGFGEDTNFDGTIAGDTNSNRIYEVTEAWSETDPLNPDTDGDGLPDGWENEFSLDPLDNGTNSFRTATPLDTDGTTEHGAEGNPDGDTIIIGTNLVPYVNILEFQNGTNPRVPNFGAEPPDTAIHIGPGDPIGTAGGETLFEEFTDWNSDDCVALDEYEGDGFNNQQGDINPAFDGFDTSRDILAFYARDGGPSATGGDDKFYFRLDFFDLQAFAEDGNLDIYIVIDTGQPSSGERLLPDEVDTITDMRWEVVVAAYQGNIGNIYLDDDPNNNTTDFGQDLFGFGGVIVRDQADADGFLGSYYNSELDSVEIAISRQALLDAGWNGLNPEDLNYQVFTTRDGTCNSCVDGGAGAGDRGGETDIRDTIFDDFLAEDNFFAKQGIQPILRTWLEGSFTCGTVKFAPVIHGNQAIQPGSVIQNLVNDGAGAGYHRPLEIHETMGQPLGLHITATLASALEWARVDPAFTNDFFRDGPALNDKVAALLDTNVVDLFGSTFSGHILPYFTPEYNQDNEALAREFLEAVYETDIDPDKAMFWTPERVADGDVFNKILDMGYDYTLIDQELHMREWFGRETALGNDGFRINRIHGVNCFIINDLAVRFRFDNADNGLGLPLRRLLSRKARSGEQQQVVTIMSNWEDFGELAQADAYDANLRWIANHQWIRTVTHEQIANGEVGGDWFVLDRGTPAINKVAHDFVHHNSEGNYDNWYLGSAQEEGLQPKIFDIRPGVPVPGTYGMLFFGGIVSQAWDSVLGLLDPDIGNLARGAMHASTFETAFHEEDNADLSTFSTGDYIVPDTTFDFLIDFAKQAQSQSREVALYEQVDQWADEAWMGVYDTSAVATNRDVDLDGEDEYLLYNDRLFVALEAIGGRLIGAWAIDVLTHEVFQAGGNLAGFAGQETEEEGASNVDGSGQVVAYRTSGLKDWFAQTGGPGVGTTEYVNDLYTVAAAPGGDGWELTSSDGNVSKTVTLAPQADRLEVDYRLSGDVSKLFVRFGFSPHLYDLLKRGQETLADIADSGGVVSLVNTTYAETVSAFIGYSDAGHSNLFWNAAAVDDDPGSGVNFFTVKMRNQAQTHQVEMESTGTAFTFSLGFKAVQSDWDGDGIPNLVEDDTPGLDSSDGNDGEGDLDGDGITNTDEFRAGTGINDPADFPQVGTLEVMNNPGILIVFPTEEQRDYFVYYTDDPLADNPVWLLATTNPIPGNGGITNWLDDGSATDPHPFDRLKRNYLIAVDLPE